MTEEAAPWKGGESETNEHLEEEEAKRACVKQQAAQDGILTGTGVVWLRRNSSAQ